MLKRIIIAQFLCLVLVCPVSYTHPHSSTAVPVWKNVTKAYASGDLASIKKYTASNKQNIRLYAMALRDLLKGNVDALNEDGHKCDRSTPTTSSEAASYFWCLSAISTAFFHQGLVKKGFLWRARLASFYRAHADDIDKATHLSDPAGIKGSKLSGSYIVHHWPDQLEFDHAGGWGKIKLHGSMAAAYIDGKQIMMQVDTGSNSIFLSQQDVKKLNLRKYLNPIGSATFSETTTQTTSVGKRYYVKDFTFGPVHIQNAYLIVYKGNTSIIGMNVLKRLGKFSISAHGLKPFHKSKLDACGPMMHSLSPITGGSSFPFVQIQTNVGRLGLMLDSGLLGHGPFEDADISLDLDNFGNIKKYLNDTNASVANARFHENGKSVELQTVIFKIEADGHEMVAYFNRKYNYDKKLSGSFTKHYLNDHVVSYDFPGRKMCIRRTN